jgi:hypothetical protein
MAQQTRAQLKQEFQDGERPSGADFVNVFDSFLSKQDDGVTIDASGTLVVNQGLRLGNSGDNTLGTLRFNGASVQVHDGSAFVNVGGGGGAGAFGTLVGGEVAYTGGNSVGIGPSFTANPPTFRFEVDIGANTGPAQQVRFGEAVVHMGQGAQTPSAHFSHRQHATTQNYALRQRNTGEVSINAPVNVPIFFSQGGSAANARMTIAGSGEVLIGTANPIQPNALLHVGGNAIKTTGGNTWATPSDARLKEDVSDYTRGLAAIRQVRPVSYRYNGRAGTEAGAEGIGIIGQEIEAVLPETITRCRLPEGGMDDLRIYDSGALVYALVNAVKELAQRVETLEAGRAPARPDA